MWHGARHGVVRYRPRAAVLCLGRAPLVLWKSAYRARGGLGAVAVPVRCGCATCQLKRSEHRDVRCRSRDRRAAGTSEKDCRCGTASVAHRDSGVQDDARDNHHCRWRWTAGLHAFSCYRKCQWSTINVLVKQTMPLFISVCCCWFGTVPLSCGPCVDAIHMPQRLRHRVPCNVSDSPSVAGSSCMTLHRRRQQGGCI